jgi:large subunit ribosomal protein L15
MKLNEINDNNGARKPRKRVGRGIGSGVGKTGGRGQKGQKSRTGVAIKGYEGGQMPLYRRLPKRGFSALRPKRFAVVNVGRLQAAVDAGRIDAGKPVTEAVLNDSGVVRRVGDGVRILGGGELTAKLQIEVTGASKAAVAAVEKAGGSLAVTAPAAAESDS